MDKKKIVLRLAPIVIAAAALGSTLVACDNTAEEEVTTTADVKFITQNGDGALQAVFGDVNFVQNGNQSTTSTADLTTNVEKDGSITYSSITLNDNFRISIKLDSENTSNRVIQIEYRENAESDFKPCLQQVFRDNEEVIEIQSGFTSEGTSTGEKVTAGNYSIVIGDNITISGENLSASLTSDDENVTVNNGMTTVTANKDGTKTNVSSSAFANIDLASNPISFTCSDGSVVNYQNGTISVTTGNGSKSVLNRESGERTITTKSGKTITITPIKGTQDPESGTIPTVGYSVTDGDKSFSFSNEGINWKIGEYDGITYSTTNGLGSNIYAQTYVEEEEEEEVTPPEDNQETPPKDDEADLTPPENGNTQTPPTDNNGNEEDKEDNTQTPPTDNNENDNTDSPSTPDPEPDEPEIEIADTIAELEQAQKEQVISKFIENYKSDIVKTLGVPADDVTILGCDFDIQNVTNSGNVATANSASDSVSVILSYTQDGEVHYATVNGSFQGDATTKTLFNGDKMKCSFEEESNFNLTANNGEANDLNKTLYSKLNKNFDAQNTSVITSSLTYGGTIMTGAGHKNSANLKMVVVDKEGNVKTIEYSFAYDTKSDIQDILDGNANVSSISNPSEKNIFSSTDNTINARQQAEAQETEEGMGM